MCLPSDRSTCFYTAKRASRVTLAFFVSIQWLSAFRLCVLLTCLSCTNVRVGFLESTTFEHHYKRTRLLKFPIQIKLVCVATLFYMTRCPSRERRPLEPPGQHSSFTLIEVLFCMFPYYCLINNLSDSVDEYSNRNI